MIASEKTASQKKDLETDGAWAQSLALSFRFLFIAICLLGVGWGVSNFRLIPADSRALVLRVGTVVREQGAGLLLAAPRPFEQVMVLPSADRQIEHIIRTFRPVYLGVVSDSAPLGTSVSIHLSPRENAGLLLTGDMSVIHYDARLFYRITDAKAYVLAGEQVTPALERLFVTSAIAVSASRDLDAILVARPELETPAIRASRERLRLDLMEDVNRRLSELAGYGGGFGVTVGRVDLVPQLPAEAKTAFDSVLRTLQESETAIAQARTSSEISHQQASQSRDRIATEAEARAQEQVRDAQGRTATISALEGGTLRGPALVNQIYSDRIGPLLERAAQVLTTDTNGGGRLIIPGGSQK